MNRTTHSNLADIEAGVLISHQDERRHNLHRDISTAGESRRLKKKVWIDIDNSPHVPFFLPIIDELRKQDVELILTARNMYQVCELLDFFQLPCKVIGGNGGKNKILKVLFNLVRVLQLGPIASKSRPDLAISHGSRAQLLISKAFGIPTMMLHDYEHSIKTGFLESDWVVMPDVIPTTAMSKRTERVLKYPGLKEDVYIPRFKPDISIFSQLGIADGDLVVTVRPPATEAHYHNPEGEVLFAETLRVLASRPNLRAVVLPRNARQKEQLRTNWNDLLSTGRLLIPNSPVNGLNLLWFSDLVISGGGTMNREAAALGVPVYSIFRGKIGAVDRYLAEQGRLILIENLEDVHSKIRLVPWNRPAAPEDRHCPALSSIMSHILAALGVEKPVRHIFAHVTGGANSQLDQASPISQVK